jgi:type I restriction enzyme S subunit
MSSELHRLDSLLEITSSKRIHMADFVENGIPFYRGKEVIERAKGNAISTELFITDEKFREIKNKFGSPEDGDILLTSVGTLGVPYFIFRDGDFYFKDGNVTWFRKFVSSINSKFLYYWLTSPATQQRLDEISIGSTQKALTITALKSLEIPLPNLKIQQEVVEILDSLNHRITLLRETNATLEAIAQALFKSWFVDFDPVHAKQQGRLPEGMDELTAVLFPDSFEESELGLVPAGWEVRWINETCNLGRGSSPRPIQQYLGGDVPWIKIADATASDGMFVFETKEKIISAGVKNSVTVQPGDLIMSNSASCGITVFVELNGCIHDGWLYFKNYKHINKNFLFFWLRKIASHLVHIADGSVQKNLNIALVSSQKVICPSAEVNQAFENLAAPLLGRIRENCKQVQTLADLRDTLLPRLISGQLGVVDVEEISA